MIIKLNISYIYMNIEVHILKTARKKKQKKITPTIIINPNIIITPTKTIIITMKITMKIIPTMTITTTMIEILPIIIIMNRRRKNQKAQLYTEILIIEKLEELIEMEYSEMKIIEKLEDLIMMEK